MRASICARMSTDKQSSDSPADQVARSAPHSMPHPVEAARRSGCPYEAMSSSRRTAPERVARLPAVPAVLRCSANPGDES